MLTLKMSLNKIPFENLLNLGGLNVDFKTSFTVFSKNSH